MARWDFIKGQRMAQKDVSNFHPEDIISPDCKGRMIELEFIGIKLRQMFVQSRAIKQMKY